MKKIESLFLGIIAALGALVVITAATLIAQIFMQEKYESTIETYFYNPSFIFFSVLIEEFSKYLFINKGLAPKKTKDSLLMNAVFFGLGFALTEIALILFGNYSMEKIYLNILGITLIHISTSFIIIWLIVKNIPWQIPKIILILSGAIIPHLTYNMLSLYEKKIPLAPLFILLFVVILTFLLRAQIKENTLA